MNEEELRNQINASIKCEKLREYLLDCLKSDGALNSLNFPSFIIEKASQRFKDKIKACQKIESDLFDELIPDPNSYIILPRLRELRKLVVQHTERLESTTEKKSSYNEIKGFILKILRLDFNLQLKYFDLTILLLPKIILDQHLNKELAGAFDLLKLFVNEPKHLPNEENLQSISNLDREENEDIRKCFYGIVHELDKKLLFRDLLNQLLEIIKNQNKTPLMKFSIIFITICLNDKEMEAEAFNQAIDLVYQALKHPEDAIKKRFNGFKKIFNQKNLSDYLTEFEKDFREKISSTIINTLNQSAQAKKQYCVDNILKGLDFDTSFFLDHINNEIIKNKLYEAKAAYNESKKSIIDNEKITLKNRFSQFGNRAHRYLEAAKIKTSAVMLDIEERVEMSRDQLMNLTKKNNGTSYQKKNEETQEIDLNSSLKPAKAKLSSIKKKLDAWNIVLNSIEPHEDYQNRIDTNLIDLDHYSEFIVNLEASINNKYSSLIQQIPDKFIEIITNIKEKGYWFAESEVSKPSLAYKIFYRGYFNRDFSIKKINAKLGNTLSFDKINDFVSRQSFWTLLTYGIVRWPWRNKTDFSHTWAEQLCLPKVIIETEELKKNLETNSNHQHLETIMALLETFPSFKNEAVTRILGGFKKNIVVRLSELKVLEQKIDDRLKETEGSLSTISSSTPFSSEKTVSDDSAVTNSIIRPHF